MKKVVVVLALLIPLSGFGQTSPEVNDPNIKARWLSQSVYDTGKTLATDSIGEQALNIMIIGDGFTNNQAEDFFTKVARGVDFFTSVVPYRERFNCLAIFLPSLESGIDDPLLGAYKDTALNSGYNDSTGDLSPQVSPTPYLERFLGRSVNTERDFLVMVVNIEDGNFIDNVHHHTDVNIWPGRLAVDDIVSFEKDPPYTMTHELGHLIAGLEDEYFALGQGRDVQVNRLMSSGGTILGVNLFGYADTVWDADAITGPEIARECLGLRFWMKYLCQLLEFLTKNLGKYPMDIMKHTETRLESLASQMSYMFQLLVNAQ